MEPITDSSDSSDSRFTASTVNQNTIIPFGKFRGKPHSTFYAVANLKYVKWIIDQGEDFRYSKTRDWLISELARLEA